MTRRARAAPAFEELDEKRMVQVTERLEFISKPNSDPKLREHIHLEVGVVLEVLAPNQNEQKDLAERTRAGRPGFVVVHWEGLRRNIPALAVRWVR